MISTHWQALLSAVQFLTVCPVPPRHRVEAGAHGKSLLWYPAVGLAIGVLLQLALSGFGDHGLLGAALVLFLWVVITGGLHLDGLADCADAWLGGLGDRDKTLSILKDPRAGSMAVVALLLILLLKLTALSALLASSSFDLLWTVPLWGRLSVLPLFLSTPYARAEGYGALLVAQMPRRAATMTTALVVAALWVLLPFPLWMLQLSVFVLLLVIVRTASLRTLGGFTGDVAGAQIELLETTLLVTLALFSGI